MRVGVPAEVKNSEARVALTPAGANALVRAGHEVVIEAGAGVGSHLPDDDYRAVGATLGTADEAWACELVLKVKEPVASEYRYLREDLTLFAYLHLAADEALTDALLAAKNPTATCALSSDMNRTTGRNLVESAFQEMPARSSHILARKPGG